MLFENHAVTLGDVYFHLVVPEVPNGAGLVIVPTMYGLGPDRFMRPNTSILDIAARYGAKGFTIAVWDFYAGDPPTTDRDRARAMSARLRDAWAVRQISSCVTYLSETRGQKKVGALGYCVGGRFIFLHGAKDHRLAAAAAVYPSVHKINNANQDENAIERAGEMICPVLMAYPGRDETTAQVTFEGLQRALQGRKLSSATTTSLFYPHAEHGFFSRPGQANEAATATAWAALDAFFVAHLVTALN